MKETEGYDTHKKLQVVITSLIKRYDQGGNEDIKSINKNIQSLCTSKGLSFIDNSNIDRSRLNRSKLHLNRRGSSFLANNFKKFVNSLWKSKPFAKICQCTHEPPTNSLAELKSLRIRNHNNVIFSYLSINSIRKKFDNLTLIIDEHVDILCVAETKIDNSFPTAQFSWPGYHKPYRLDISDRKGGLLVYIRSHLPSLPLTNYIIPKIFKLYCLN